MVPIEEGEAASAKCQRPGQSLRLLVSLLAILCTAFCYMSRQNLSLAIIAMVKATNSSTEEEMTTYGPKYDWKGANLLSAFFYTYVAFQIPAGRLAEVLGPKWVLLVAGAGSALLSGLSPWAASLAGVGAECFFALRLLMGACQAAIFPACYTILTNWLPLRERQLALPVMNLSAYFGSIIAIETTGLFNSTPSLGWPYAFYLPACVCALWSCCWLGLASSRPEEHPAISKRELDYIVTSKQGEQAAPTSRPLAWTKLLRSRQIWALIMAFFSSNWSFCLMMQLLPTYLFQIQGIPTRENAHINVHMYIIFCVSAPLVAYASSALIERRLMSRLLVRKLFQSIAVFGQALAFLVLTQLGRDQRHVRLLLYLQMASYSFVNGGEVHLPTEISAEFGGTIYAVANSVGSMNGFIVPLVQGFMITEAGDIDQWNVFLFLAAGVSLAGNLVFLVLGDNQPQDFSCRDEEAKLSHEAPNFPPGTFRLIESSFSKPETRAQFCETDKIASFKRDYHSTSKPQPDPSARNLKLTQ